MLPNLGLIAATVGLIAILWLILREERRELGSLERSSLLAGGAVVVLVAAWHLLASGGGH